MPLTCLSQAITPELRYVSDVEAARLYVMNALNKPGAGSSPELWLRDAYITRLYREVEEAILCIAENQLVDTSPDEAARLKVKGLECYVSFPYHREVYAYCKRLLQKKYDHFLTPFFDVASCATKAEAPRLRYQLQQFMICALYSVASSRNGTCLPSHDGDGNLDIVELDANALRSKASVFWENLPWTVNHFYREAVGAGNYPANQGDFYRQVPLWHGEIREGKDLAKQLMAEAFALKSAIISPGAYHPIDGGGCLAAGRLREFEEEVMATFCGPAGGFIQASMRPSDGVWRINIHASRAAKIEIGDRFEKTGIFAGKTGLERLAIWDGEFDILMERLEVGIGVFLAALIRDFWVVEQRGSVFSDKLQTKKVRRLHAESLRAGNDISAAREVRYRAKQPREGPSVLENP